MLLKKCLMVFVYLCLSSFAAFLINFKEHQPPFLISFPNIDLNYDKPFKTHALYKPLCVLLIWCIHHSLFIREPIRKIIKNKLNLGDKSQLILYRLIAGILLLILIFTWNSSNNSIGGGFIWNIEPLSSSNNWFIRNFCFLIIISVLIYVLRELGRLNVVRSDVIITDSIYGVVRHPVQLCFLLLLWFTPRMTVSRLIFCVLLTIYVFIGLYLEEQTLIKKFGTSYSEYKQNFPALMPHRKIHFESYNNNKNNIKKDC
eukprot:9022_1